MRMNIVKPPTRRAVRGITHKDCEFCGRTKETTDGKPMNYQYLDTTTDRWDAHVFCSKVCYSAWHCINQS